MTKTIRIENADTSKYKVKVITQEKIYNPDTQKMGEEWQITKVTDLLHPTSMLQDYLTTTKRFIIEENGVSD